MFGEALPELVPASQLFVGPTGNTKKIYGYCVDQDLQNNCCGRKLSVNEIRYNNINWMIKFL